MIKAIIGLGNPGSRFVHTRHNIGFRILDELAAQFGGQWRELGDIMYCAVRPESSAFSSELLLIKPQTFMNNSGRVISFLTKKGISIREAVVVHDELEKKFGHESVRFGGSARGHNGLRSIISMGGSDFWRMRFGIGRPENDVAVADYVLMPFNEQEEQQMQALLQKATALILSSNFANSAS